MRFVVLAMVGGLFFGPIGCASESSPAGSAVDFPPQSLETIESDGRALRIEVRTAPEQPPSRGETNVQFSIADPAGRTLEGLEFTPELWMPYMGHGASTEPVVHEQGNGLYLFSNCEFFMEGVWELRAKVSGSVEDHATARFSIP